MVAVVNNQPGSQGVAIAKQASELHLYKPIALLQELNLNKTIKSPIVYRFHSIKPILLIKTKFMHESSDAVVSGVPRLLILMYLSVL